MRVLQRPAVKWRRRLLRGRRLQVERAGHLGELAEFALDVERVRDAL